MIGDLRITGIQTNLIWQDPSANRAHFSTLIENAQRSDVYVLPEMFSTGFSMESELLAEEMVGATHRWMIEMAQKMKAVVCGSLILRDGEKIFNRFLWVDSNGETTIYDKRHRFTMAGEHKHFSAGNKQVIVELKGWRIMLQVCYDLRFPVWSRNRDNYDALIYVANWPAARAGAWSKLLPARAIENQCYVVGVNRVGTDGNGIEYSGGSVIVDPKGELVADAPLDKKATITASLSMDELVAFREKFPVMEDGDEFELKIPE